MASAPSVPGVRPLHEWSNLLSDPTGPAFAALAKIYGTDRALLQDQAAFVRQALDLYARTFRPDASILIVRSSGRINLVGMHIDHRGGDVNPVAVREAWFLCEPRDDDVLDCANTRADLFPRRTFSIREELGPDPIPDWDRWTQALAETRKAQGTQGDWVNYIKSAALYLEHIRAAPDPHLRGMNLLVAGRIPLSAGLSSSSSIVVGTTEALIRINDLNISPHDMIDICGQAEWYVGTRGGSGDHAAIKFGRLGHVSHLGSHPLTVDAAPFPDDYRIVLCNSLIEASKSGTARDEFNNRIASYEFGLMLLKKHFPAHAPKMERLRDVNTDTLDVTDLDLYRMLLALPQRMTRADVLAALPEHQERIRHVFGSHAEPPAGYPVRKVCAFGIAECVRSKLAADALRQHDVARFGEITTLSHHGDRVTRLDTREKRVPLDKAIPDAALADRMADLESGDAERIERARLWRLPGGYDCSLPDLDAIVDLCLATPGAVTARVVGAGLGGAVHAVVHKDHVADVIQNLAAQYYEPKGFQPAAEVYSPVGGAGLFDV